MSMYAMPSSAPRNCSHPGCTALVRGGPRCPEHATPDRRPARVEKRTDPMYWTARWRKLRAQVLLANPVCQADGCASESTHVDHIIPHRGDQYLAWDRYNLQALCARCHSRKTASQDGGFGNRRSASAATAEAKHA